MKRMQDETTASRWETIETRDSETRFDEDVEESIPGFHETDSGNADCYTSMTGGVPKSDGVLGWAEVDESNQQITRPVCCSRRDEHVCGRVRAPDWVTKPPRRLLGDWNPLPPSSMCKPLRRGGR
jgi:hypothetical protein